MNAELFVFIDIIKGALLRRMAREVALVWTDDFLSPGRRMQAVTLYERVGDNFVSYIKTLHAIKTPEFLYIVAGNAVKVFQDNLDKIWVYAYDGHAELIDWLPVSDKVQTIIDEF